MSETLSQTAPPPIPPLTALPVSPRYPAYLLDGRLQLVAANPAALAAGRNFLAIGDILAIGGAALTAVLPEHHAALARLLAGTVRPSLPAGPSVAVIGGADGRRAVVRAVALAPPGPAQAGRILLTVEPLDEHPDAATIAAVLGLTPAEARLAAALCGGATLREAAAALSITQNTARDRLKSIFLKTGVRRQVELVMLMLRLW